jgi:hypothetical protein
MNKFLLEAVFSVVPTMAFASGAEMWPNTPVVAQAAICTEHDLLVQKIGNAYHTQFQISCAPVSVSTTRTSSSPNGDAHSGNQELSQQ